LVGAVLAAGNLRSFVRVLFAAAVLVAASRSVHAEGLPVEPGLWEVTWSMPDPLRGEPIRQVERTCVRDRVITAERVNAKMQQCRISNAVIHGPTARWKMRCDTPAGPMTGTGSLRSSPVAVAGSVEMTVALGALEIPVTGAFKGRRIGDCR